MIHENNRNILVGQYVTFFVGLSVCTSHFLCAHFFFFNLRLVYDIILTKLFAKLFWLLFRERRQKKQKN